MNHDAPEAVTEDVIEDLRARLRAFRPVALPTGMGWQRGTDPEYLAKLVAYWAESYDWRPHEERIRRLPWTSTATRAIHQQSSHAGARTVLLLHGWPDSVLRFERLLPLLTDFHVVVPALPGYPFATPVTGHGMSADQMAGAVAETMTALGHDRYVVSAGDVGCDVAEVLAARHPDRVAALHLTDVSQHHFRFEPPADLSETERAYVRRGRDWQAREGGYTHEQSTKPHTLAAALGDSPAGLAAWLVEKLRGWTDCDGDVETVFTRDEILTWVTAYWVTGTIGTSFTPYATAGAASARITPPAVFTVFPRDLVNAPREFAERFFDVRVWREEARGGHFAAWEQPARYAAGVHDAARLGAA